MPVQCCVVVTRLAIDWPHVIRGLQVTDATTSGVTDALTFSPSCLAQRQDGARQARAQVAYGLAAPLCTIAASLALWACR